MLPSPDDAGERTPLLGCRGRDSGLPAVLAALSRCFLNVVVALRVGETEPACLVSAGMPRLVVEAVRVVWVLVEAPQEYTWAVCGHGVPRVLAVAAVVLAEWWRPGDSGEASGLSHVGNGSEEVNPWSRDGGIDP